MSFRSKFWITLIRYRHLFQGKLKPEIVDESFSVEKFRQSIDRMSARGTNTIKGLSIQSTTLKGLNAEWLLPNGAPKAKVILYIHGGGFISGSCLTHRRHVAKFALGSGLNTLCLIIAWHLSIPSPQLLKIASPPMKACWSKVFRLPI
jgi:epsilon-lactone hydrolase